MKRKKATLKNYFVNSKWELLIYDKKKWNFSKQLYVSLVITHWFSYKILGLKCNFWRKNYNFKWKSTRKLVIEIKSD
jgi:hypothetical protein